MYLHKTTIKAIEDFSSFLRGNTTRKIKSVLPGRDTLYKQLVNSVIDDTLDTAYPLTAQLLTDAEWSALKTSFFALHNCTTPVIWKMPQELIKFTGRRHKELTGKYPHLLNLMHFEWEETAVFMMPDTEQRTIKNGRNKFRLNTEFKIIDVRYPVHLQQPAAITRADKGRFFILILRNPDTKLVEFFDISAIHLLFLKELSASDSLQSGYTALSGFTHIPEKELRTGMKKFIESLSGKLFLTVN